MLDNCKAQTSAACLPGMPLIYPIESFKHMLLMFFRNANAGNLYGTTHTVLILCQLYNDAAASRCVFNCIVDQIVEQFPQQYRITRHHCIATLRRQVYSLFLRKVLETVLQIIQYWPQ